MPFEFKHLEIPDVILIKPVVFNDSRGHFFELYKEEEFYNYGIKEKFIQDNCSFSKKDVVRGLHYQLNPKAQGKLIKVISGEINDVIVDLRINSPTFKKSINVNLSDTNNLMIYVPVGFAHGFETLSENAYVLYKTNEVYSPEHDCGIRYNDPSLNIEWITKNPILSEKDKNLLLLNEIIDKNYLF